MGSEADPGHHITADVGALEDEGITVGVLVECGAAEVELALDGGPRGVDCSVGFEGVDLSVSSEGPGEHTSGDVGALEVERNTVGVLVECGAAEVELALDGGPRGADCSMGLEAVPDEHCSRYLRSVHGNVAHVSPLEIQLEKLRPCSIKRSLLASTGSGAGDEETPHTPSPTAR